MIFDLYEREATPYALSMPRLRATTAENQMKFPPLTDDDVAACEAEFGVRFPVALVDLLKEQNGGYFENSDFKLKGSDWTISGIDGISPSAKRGRIQPLSRILDPTFFSSEELQEIHDAVGDPAKVLPFSGDGHCFYVLDYNRRNECGEPMVLYLCIEGGVSCRTVADSFAEMLAGQYEGDAEPTVRMEEADDLRVIAAGSYSGWRENVPERLRHSWKTCVSGDRIIVLATENHGWGINYERYELQQSALSLTSGRLDDVEGELEPELAALIRPMVEAPLIQEWAEGQGLNPPCYQLSLPVDPDEHWVGHQTSAPYGAKWKNTSGRIVYACVFSASRRELQEALEAVAKLCS